MYILAFKNERCFGLNDPLCFYTSILYNFIRNNNQIKYMSHCTSYLDPICKVFIKISKHILGWNDKCLFAIILRFDLLDIILLYSYCYNIFLYQETFILTFNISVLLQLTFVNTQHAHTNTKGYFVLVKRF